MPSNKRLYVIGGRSNVDNVHQCGAHIIHDSCLAQVRLLQEASNMVTLDEVSCQLRCLREIREQINRLHALVEVGVMLMMFTNVLGWSGHS